MRRTATTYKECNGESLRDWTRIIERVRQRCTHTSQSAADSETASDRHPYAVQLAGTSKTGVPAGSSQFTRQ
jgi:hypothetical protein